MNISGRGEVTLRVYLQGVVKFSQMRRLGIECYVAFMGVCITFRRLKIEILTKVVFRCCKRTVVMFFTNAILVSFVTEEKKMVVI